MCLGFLGLREERGRGPGPEYGPIRFAMARPEISHFVFEMGDIRSCSAAADSDNGIRSC